MFEALLSSPLGADWSGGAGLLLLGGVFLLSGLIFIPRPAMCLFAGLTFGLSAFPVALLGTTLGAVLAFLLSRHVFQSRVRAIAARRPRLKLIMDAVDAEGWRLLGLLRLASPVPGPVSNYLFGVTGMGLWPYVAVTALGTAPQVLAFIYLGTAGRIAFDAQPISAVKLVATLTGCILSIGAIFLITRRVKSMLAVKLAEAGS